MIIYFSNFIFEAFKDSLKELCVEHKLHNIKFYPDNEKIFKKEQLENVGDNWDLNSDNSFIGRWKEVKKKVKKVRFHYSSKDKRSQITMSVNLDKKIMEIEQMKGISENEIKEIFKSRMYILEKKNKIKNYLNLKPSKIGIFLKKYYFWIIIIPIVVFFILYLGFELTGMNLGPFHFESNQEEHFVKKESENDLLIEDQDLFINIK